MRQFEAVLKELLGQLKSAKAERKKERKDVAVNGDKKYHAVERLISVSTYYNPRYCASENRCLICSEICAMIWQIFRELRNPRHSSNSLCT